MPILENDNGDKEIIKCGGYCLSSEKYKTCHETACRLVEKKKKTEKDINKVGWDTLQEVQKNLY
ncbi:MAG: hypothetical protein PHG82_02800 [Candidatus Gracilibacteria bacterium]|nr:hypothetical protein [Candidatus Gracilibacteria bacterium]